MRTKDEIIEWLNTQSWRDAFYKNHCVLGGVDGDTLKFDERLILRAFYWSNSPEGALFWDAIDKAYKSWYYTKVMSWSEFCQKKNIIPCNALDIIPNKAKEELEAFAKLKLLRKYWVNGNKYCPCKIIIQDGNIVLSSNPTHNMSGLSFPDIVMAGEFVSTFKELILKAAPLL